MKILHTSDWHVGKVLKGRDRHDEHVAVLGSLVGIARDEDVDLVLIAGDLFETAAPTARSQGLVMRTLLALREDGRQVVVIAGNHDNQGLHRRRVPAGARRDRAARARPAKACLTRAAPRSCARGTARTCELPRCRSCRTATRSARQRSCSTSSPSTPWTTQAGSPRSSALLTAEFSRRRRERGDGARDAARRAPRRRRAGRADQPGLRAARRACSRGSAHYVALGHLHRQQEIPGPCPIFYSGSPLAVDFGEEANEPSALVVTAEPGIRADASRCPRHRRSRPEDAARHAWTR